ncbi:hypothetical protein BJ1_gp55 [Halorubrum virus BJ1]|uniref:Uncharacterized protein n=1 Tax=Halorubrum virus BJ1 TaxID=416419 RepID=A0ZYR8_9CAUD|nr:hypothetical protein BJ1_gp55 [Halorubrum virus BJ1]CAL92477.1 hypothetical protein [Halorubrum virus BJ1]
MPVAEKVTGGEVLLRGIGERVSIGDRVDVSEEFATYLSEERGDFRIVEGETGSTDDPDEADDDEFDLDEFLGQNVPPIEGAIAAGEVDDHLEAIGEASERTGVQDAVGERRAELEG